MDEGDEYVPQMSQLGDYGGMGGMGMSQGGLCIFLYWLVHLSSVEEFLKVFHGRDRVIFSIWPF